LARAVALPAVRTGVRWPRPSAKTIWLAVIVAVLACLTAYPLLLLFIGSFQVNQPGQAVVWGLDGWRAALSDPSVGSALANTLILSAARTVISVALAVFLAWAIARTDVPLKGWMEFMLWLGFFLPQLPVTMGWILLLEPDFGLLNKLLVSVFHLAGPPFNITSYGGIIWAHLGFSTCITFLLLTPAFRAMDSSLEEAATTSGSSGLRTLLRVTLPVLTPAMLAVGALGFIKSLESFEVEMVLGVPAGIYVYATRIWEYLHWEPPQYGPATALSTLFLAAIVLMVWLQRRLLGQRRYTTVTGKAYKARTASLGQWRLPVFAACLLFIVSLVIVPVIFLLLSTFMRLFGFFQVSNPWTLQHWGEAFSDAAFMRSLLNTLAVALGASVAGGLLFALLSYILVRVRFAARGAMDLLCWLPWAMPGVLISLALLTAVLGSGRAFTPLYGTIYLLMLAMIIKELPLGTQVLKSSLVQISDDLEEAAATAGGVWLDAFRRIVLPLLAPSILAVGLIIFLSAVNDIPTMVFLSSFNSRTVSLVMLDYMTQGKFETASVFGVVLVVIVVIVAAFARTLGLRLGPSARA